jgi:hypothetical protein
MQTKVARRRAAGWQRTATICILGITSLAATSASAAAADTGGRGQVPQICSQTMGLAPTSLAYDDCVRSLNQTLASVDAQQATERGRSLCINRGLAPGSQDFAVCVVKAEQAAPTR